MEDVTIVVVQKVRDGIGRRGIEGPIVLLCIIRIRDETNGTKGFLAIGVVHGTCIEIIRKVHCIRKLVQVLVANIMHRTIVTIRVSGSIPKGVVFIYRHLANRLFFIAIDKTIFVIGTIIGRHHPLDGERENCIEKNDETVTFRRNAHVDARSIGLLVGQKVIGLDNGHRVRTMSYVFGFTNDTDDFGLVFYQVDSKEVYGDVINGTIC